MTLKAALAKQKQAGVDSVVIKRKNKFYYSEINHGSEYTAILVARALGGEVVCRYVDKKHSYQPASAPGYDDPDNYFCWHKIPYGNGKCCTACGGLIKTEQSVRIETKK